MSDAKTEKRIRTFRAYRAPGWPTWLVRVEDDVYEMNESPDCSENRSIQKVRGGGTALGVGGLVLPCLFHSVTQQPTRELPANQPLPGGCDHRKEYEPPRVPPSISGHAESVPRRFREHNCSPYGLPAGQLPRSPASPEIVTKSPSGRDKG